MKIVPKTFKVKLSQTLVRSENCYKGPFETIEALMQVVAFEGDYADCYETDSRWKFINDAWTNTHQPIPEDPRYALESDVSAAVAPNTIAKRDNAGSLSVAAPTSTLHATNKEYVDVAVEQLQRQITEHDDEVSQSIEQLQSDLDDEVSRATDAEAALQQSVNEKLPMQSATTALPQAYVKQANGDQSMQDIDTAQTPNTLALRDASGRLKTFAPTDDNDAATKRYVDAAVEQIDAEAVALQNALNNEISRATAAEEANAQAIASETSAREQADNTINATLSELQSGKLDKTFANAVITNIAYSYNQADDSSTLVVSVVNPSNAQTSTINITLPKATASQPGLMTKESVTALSQLISRVSALEGKQFRYLYTTSANPTADDINTFVLAQGEVAPFSGVEVIVEATKHIWRYYQNDNIGWRDDGIDTVSIASQTQIGVVQGSTENGKVFVEDDGTMSLNGYDALVNADSTNAQAISAETSRAQQAEQANATAAQNALTAANAKYTKPATGIPETDLSSDVQTKLNESGGTTVEANPTEEATQTLQKLKVENSVYSIPQGAEVIDLGEVTLTEYESGGVKIAIAAGITVSAEQATQAQATSPCIAKVVIKGDTHELIRTQISDDASAAYIDFAATEDLGEGTKFYQLQITIPLTGGAASANFVVTQYDILHGLNVAYEAGGLTFENGVATKTLTEEEVGEWGYNQIRFWDNANSSEQYTLYLSHTNTGASLIDSHNYDYFGVVENASVTGEAGGITAFAAYLEGTTLTIEQVALGSGGGVEVVDLGTVTLTQSGTDETIKTGTVSITSEQLSQMTGDVPAVVKFTISGSGSLQISLSERVGDASSPSATAYVGAFQNGTNTIKSYLVNAAGSSATIQEVTLYTVTPNAGTGGTPLTSLKVGATTYSIPQQIDNGIPAGGLAGQALTKQSAADYDVAWTSINTSEPTVITEEAYAEALAAGTIENDKLYYIQGTSDDTLTTAAKSTTYDNATSGLAATNVQDAIDELKENEFSGSYNDLTNKPTIPTTLAELSERSYNDLTDKPAIPTTLAELSEKSYNDLTDKPTIPTLDVASIATALGLTTAQLNNLIAFAKSITSADASGTTVNNEFTAQSFDTTA